MYALSPILNDQIDDEGKEWARENMEMYCAFEWQLDGCWGYRRGGQTVADHGKCCLCWKAKHGDKSQPKAYQVGWSEKAQRREWGIYPIEQHPKHGCSCDYHVFNYWPRDLAIEMGVVKP